MASHFKAAKPADHPSAGATGEESISQQPSRDKGQESFSQQPGRDKAQESFSQQPGENAPPSSDWASRPLGLGHASIWSMATFGWMGPLIGRAGREGLNDPDCLPFMEPKDHTPNLAARFDAMYQRMTEHTARSSRPGNPAFGSYLRLFRWVFGLQALWVLLEIVIRVSGPIILKEFLTFLEASQKGTATQGPWWGWTLALLQGINAYGYLLMHHQLFWSKMRTGFHMRQQAITAIQAKVLRLNGSSMAAISAGHVVNMVSNDVRRFDDALPYWVFLWAAPLELVVVVVLICREVGPAPGLLGITAMLAVIPLQAALVRLVGGLRQGTAVKTDERVRVTSEVVQGALAMKMLCWEDPFQEQIKDIRLQEARVMRRMAWIRAINGVMVFVLSPVVALITWGTLIAMGGTLSVPSVFYTMALLQLPRMYVVLFFVFAVQTFTELRVSLKRINAFLAEPEPPMCIQTPEGSGKPAGTVSIPRGNFTWATADPLKQQGTGTAAGGQFSLKDIQLEVAPGELVGICGEVGSGKSSLLSVLLGELQQSSSGPERPCLVGRVAYCAQLPWIMAGTLRDNILFGRQYEEKRYSRALEACALGPDIAELPAGDQTELGERGINLSGGQKARVALARAVYSGAQVQLMDDPLSAVDPRVGRVLFEQCIGNQGLMAGASRILVTHQRQFLPRCDRILVLREGRIVAQGSWEQVAALQLKELLAGSTALGSLEDTEDDVLQSQQAQPDQLPINRLASFPLPAGSDSPAVSDSSASQSPSHTPATANTPRTHQPAEAPPPPGAHTPGATAPGVLANTAAHGDVTREAVTREAVTREAVTREAVTREAVTREAVTRQGVAHGGLEQAEVVVAMPADVELTSAAAGTLPAVSHAPLLSPPDAKVKGGVEGRPVAEAEADAEAETGEEKAEAGRGKQVAAALSGARTFDMRTLKLNSSGASLNDMSRASEGDDRTDRWTLTKLSHSLRRSTFNIKALNMGRSSSAKALRSDPDALVGQLVRAETRVEGSIALSVYASYCKHVGVFVTCLILLGVLGGQAVLLASEWWLAQWAHADPASQADRKWVLTYGLLTAGLVAMGVARSGLFYEYTLKAATKIHHLMIQCLVYAPLSFFHTNPAGRILNRFSKDQGQVDDLLPLTIFDVFSNGSQVLGSFVLICIAVPVILPVFLPLVVLFYFLRTRYVRTSREVKRLDGTTRSLAFTSLSATLRGLPTIRAYQAEEQFRAKFLQEMDLNGSWWFGYCGLARWVGMRMDFISASTIAAGSLLAMALRGWVSPSLLGLALSRTLDLTGTLQWFVRQSAEVENQMTSVERMVEYTALPQEPPRLSQGGKKPPAGWPASGRLKYDQVSARYRPGLPPVLLDLSFDIPAGTSCGVVGRTGSGKSSLMLTLYRLIDVTGGAIYLDGVDTSAMAVDSLRQQLAIIPQDPVLFSGTLRSNLDPWDRYTDAQLWEVLGAVQLKGAISAMGGMSARMAECGDNLSVGQRQLFCLARALLQKAKVLALDEATANVDRATDELIQQALREYTRPAGRPSEDGCVLLVIAHRIDTILDCDQLLVLNHGRLVESGPPGELSGRPGGTFAGMLAAARGVAARRH